MPVGGGVVWVERTQPDIEIGGALGDKDKQMSVWGNPSLKIFVHAGGDLLSEANECESASAGFEAVKLLGVGAGQGRQETGERNE